MAAETYGDADTGCGIMTTVDPSRHFIRNHGVTTINTLPTPSIDRVRAAIASSKSRRQRGSSTTKATNDAFSYMSVPIGGSGEFRFTPDGDLTNALFWFPRYQLKLPFGGIEGGDYETMQDVVVTCMSMKTWGQECYVAVATKPLWNDPDTESIARRYWPKQSALAQGFVVNAGFAETVTPDNPIRPVILLPSIISILEDAVNDPEREHSPVDYEHGSNFLFNVTSQGIYRSYVKSKFKKESPITEAQRSAIETHGLRNLKDLVGAPPTQAALDLLPEMLEASLAGEPFNHKKWGEHYRAWPAGGGSFQRSSGAAVKPSNQTQDSIMAAIARRVTVTVGGEPASGK